MPPHVFSVSLSHLANADHTNSELLHRFLRDAILAL
jgi:hypothetical protein